MTHAPDGDNTARRFRLGEWTVTPLEGTLVGDGEVRRLQPRQMDVLVALARRPGQVITREALLRELWGGRAMTDEPLTRCVAELRQQLGDQRAEPRYIQTIPKRGYRLVATVEWEDAAPLEDATVEARDEKSQASQASGEAAPLAAPAARHAGPLRIVGAAALAVLALTPFWFFRTPPAIAPDRTTVAVLPFADLSASSDQQYFADGVHEEIITRLSANPSLELISRTSVMPYRGSDAGVRAIGEALGASAIIEGTVRSAEGRVRVTAQLIDARSDTSLWAESYDRELTLENLFAIQGEIADRVATGIQVQFGAGTGAPATSDPRVLPTRDLAAYDEFLLGKYHYRKLQPEDLRLSVQHFQRATERDPAFAEAWEWLAYAWNHSATEQGWTTPRDAYPRARAAAVRALELDPGLAASRALLGYLRAVYDWDWAGALAELEQAMREDPQDTGTVWSYAYVLSLMGRHDRAIEVTQTLVAAAPTVGRNQLELAYRLNDAQRWVDAAATAEHALALGAEGGLAYDVLGMARLGTGDLEPAVEAFERAAELQRRAPDILAHLGYARARTGRVAEAQAILDELKARSDGVYVSPMTLAQIHAGLGDSDAAVRMLEQAAAERVRGFLAVGSSPIFAALRDDPRVVALLAQTGLPQAASP